jgi:hypothetical protein
VNDTVDSSGVRTFRESVYRSLDPAGTAMGKLEERLRAAELAIAVAGGRSGLLYAIGGAIGGGLVAIAVGWALKHFVG